MVVQHHVWLQFKEGTPDEKIAELHDALMAVSNQDDVLLISARIFTQWRLLLPFSAHDFFLQAPKLHVQLKGKIPEILHISFGRNFTTRAGSFTHGITVVLDSPEGGFAVEDDSCPPLATTITPNSRDIFFSLVLLQTCQSMLTIQPTRLY